MIRIGECHKPSTHLANLRNELPVDFDVIRVIDGDYKDAIHDKFKTFHSHGDWFYPKQEILDFFDRQEWANLTKRSKASRFKSSNERDSNIKTSEQIKNELQKVSLEDILKSM